MFANHSGIYLIMCVDLFAFIMYANLTWNKLCAKHNKSFKNIYYCVSTMYYYGFTNFIKLITCFYAVSHTILCIYLYLVNMNFEQQILILFAFETKFIMITINFHLLLVAEFYSFKNLQGYFWCFISDKVLRNTAIVWTFEVYIWINFFHKWFHYSFIIQFYYFYYFLTLKNWFFFRIFVSTLF